MTQPFDFTKALAKDRYFLKIAFRQPEKFGGQEKIQQQYQRSHETYLKRQAQLPKPEFDGSLPVHTRLDDIKKAILNNQVTIIYGEIVVVG